MEKFFIDENGEYGLDCSKAVWATDQMHQILITVSRSIWKNTAIFGKQNQN